MAGWWWPAKSKTLLNEIHKVSMLGAKVVQYDFEVLFYPIYEALQLTLPSVNDDYNHFVDFSNFDDDGFQLICKNSKEIKLELTSEQLTHLLCSEKKVLMLLKEKYGFSNSFEKVKDILRDSCDINKIDVFAKTYSTKYSVK